MNQASVYRWNLRKKNTQAHVGKASLIALLRLLNFDPFYRSQKFDGFFWELHRPVYRVEGIFLLVGVACGW